MPVAGRSTGGREGERRGRERGEEREEGGEGERTNVHLRIYADLAGSKFSIPQVKEILY